MLYLITYRLSKMLYLIGFLCPTPDLEINHEQSLRLRVGYNISFSHLRSQSPGTVFEQNHFRLAVPALCRSTFSLLCLLFSLPWPLLFSLPGPPLFSLTWPEYILYNHAVGRLTSDDKPRISTPRKASVDILPKVLLETTQAYDISCT